MINADVGEKVCVGKGKPPRRRKSPDFLFGRNENIGATVAFLIRRCAMEYPITVLYSAVIFIF